MNLKISNDRYLILNISWKDGEIIIHHISDTIQNDANRWIKCGIIDWIDESPRHTPSSSPLFLPHLKEYLEKQFSFHYELQD